MKKINLLFTIFLLILISLVSADVISVNSGGGDNLILNPNQELEGFFFLANNFPVLSNLILSSSSGTNTTNENLSVSYSSIDADGNVITNISDWRLNGNSISVLNLPLDKNVVELTSGAIRDYSTYENNGTLGGGTKSNSPTWNSNCQVGACYNFDGINDFLEISSSVSLNIEGQITISAWINADSWRTNSWEGTIVGKDDWNDGDSHGYVLRTGDNGKLSWTIAKDNSVDWPESLTSSLMSLGTWYNVLGTFNGTHLKTYINGNLKTTTVIAQTLIETSTYNVKIGQSPYESTRLFNGSIDEVQIYNQTLTPEQISVLYQAGLAGHHIEKLVSQETSKGDVWKVAMTPNDKISDGVTISSNELTIIDSLPEDPTEVSLISVDGTNESDVNLNCSAFIEDKDNSELDVFLNWIKDDISVLNQTFLNEQNGTIFSTLLSSGNLTLGEVWKCSVRTYDKNDYSSWIDSNNLTIIDITKPLVYIESPNATYNYITLEIDFNISIIENENVSVCLSSLDGEENITMNEINDSYFWYEPVGFTSGDHNVTYYCNDTSNNWGTNFTNFTILDEAAIAISLSPALAWNVNWSILSLPADDLDANGNNLNGATDYYVNISAENTNVDLYVRADGDLLTAALDSIGLGNETFVVNETDSMVPDLNRLTMSTNYVLIGENLGDLSVIYMKFYLDAPASQAAGEYLNSLDFKAVRYGQSP